MGYGDRSVALGLGIMAFGFFFLLLIIAIRVAVVWWVYQDANKRGRTDAVLWAFLAFLSPLLFLIVYLLIREQQPQVPRTVTRVCLSCGKPVGQDARFCPHCGDDLQAPADRSDSNP